MLQVNENGLLILNKEVEKILKDVQKRGNKEITYKSDDEIYGQVEKWAYPKQEVKKLVGDCEDISIYKRKLLLEAGIPNSVIMLVVCLTPNNEGHCVLCVATDKKDYILDNIHTFLSSPNEMKREGYKFLFRQQMGKGIDEPWDRLKQ